MEALIAVIDHGSFTAAADVLRISQPSLSRRIHALEKVLDTRMFVPVGRRMELTDAGRGVVTAGRRALAELSSIEAMAGAARMLTAGSLRVTGLPSLVATELPDHLGRFHRAHPGVRIEVSTVDDAQELVEAVRVGRADAAIGVADRVPGDLAAIPLPAQEFAAVLPAGARPGGAGGPLTPRDVTSRALITLPRGTSIRQLADTAIRGLGALPAHRITTTQRDSLVPLALAADGLTVVPTALARTATAFGGVAVALDPPVHRSLGIIHRPDELPNPALHEFLALVEQGAGTWPGPGGDA
ncbi:LysR family transcriptional regulator [Brachybacterium saurashtrense]|uniref:LysR family transcriptional regulator n=1 Tax=Brachybacterium saurashtrense TaxID=556288 RepID=UPI0013B36452|nr:LysR family transcriptional regulator [Brachybacterium saurashtrense]